MEQAIEKIREALADIGKPDPWSSDIKASDDFLDPLFRRFYGLMNLPNLMRNTDYHTLAPHVPLAEVDADVREALDAIADTASRARPGSARR
jgi:hypothetical protein